MALSADFFNFYEDKISYVCIFRFEVNKLVGIGSSVIFAVVKVVKKFGIRGKRFR